MLLSLFYSHYLAIYISALFALFWALFPSMVISIFFGLNFIESIPELLSSPGSKVLAILIFLIAFYFHMTASDFINDLLTPLLKKFRFNLPFHIKNESFTLDICGPDLQKKEVKVYAERILFYLMPFYEKETLINIEEVENIIIDGVDSGPAFGLCSYDNTNTLNIKIAKTYDGKVVDLDQKMSTLAHELIHCKQFLKRELLGWSWHGKNYEGVSYEERPWEIEANQYQEKMYNKYWFK
tara:strand:- start:28 stop:744 length:717 start_codon:yes stop_codon:yes gene_type:complete